MARIAFIQQELREQFGFMLMSAKLKEAGHEVEVFIIENEAQLQWEYFNNNLNYDIFGFSSTTISFEQDLEIAKNIKIFMPNVFIIFGGAHPTYNPDEVIKHDCIDAICIGEGIDAIVEMADMRSQTEYIAFNIKNFWMKKPIPMVENINNIEIIKNPIRPTNNINNWPRPDYDLYYKKYPQLANKPTKPVYIVRGCPYSCAFCYNPSFNKMYDKQKIFQCMDIDKAISEIKWLKDNYGFKYLQFISDNMTINKKWLKEFLNKYKENFYNMYDKEIIKKFKINGLVYKIGYRKWRDTYSFLMNCRANEITKDIVKLLKDSGCNRIDFGVEHGNDFIRNDILKRNMSKKQIINCGKWFKEAGIRIQTTNIFGLPHEDFNKAWESVELNRQFIPEISKACILQPFENTEVYNYAKQNNLLKDDLKYSGTTLQIGVKDNRSNESKIKIKDEKQIIRLSYLFDWFVKNKMPRWLGYIICNLPFDKYYKNYYNNLFKKQNEKYK